MEARPSSMHPYHAGFRDVFSNSPPMAETLYAEPPGGAAAMRVALEVPRVVRERKDIPACAVLIGVAVILLLLWLYRNYIIDNRHPPCRDQRSVVSTMLAQAAPTNHGNDVHLKVDPATVTNVHNLTPCNDSTCKDYKSMPAADKQAHSHNVREFMKQHDRVMLFVYAPWCPHCHNAMPAYFDAASKSDIPFALLNAELVHPDVLSGETRVCDVKYFPTIVGIERSDAGTTMTPLADAPTKDNFIKMASRARDGLEKFF